MQDIARDIAGLPVPTERLRTDEFWALSDLSFEVRRGECLGLIGPNGSGKSTLLKLVSGIFPPDTGAVRVRGRIGALIEVGAGFHPLLTGRENIYVSGAIYGMSKRQMDTLFDEIVDFADIEDALDTPVKYYSSGMYARLGFSIYANLPHEILLLDEVLAVGDAQFQQKCFRKISQLLHDGVPTIFVSHDLFNVQKICNRCLVLSAGMIQYEGSPGEAIREYGALLMARDSRKNLHTAIGSDVLLRSVEFITSDQMDDAAVARSGEPLRVRLNYEVESGVSIDNAIFEMRFWTATGALAAVVNSKTLGQDFLRLAGQGCIEIAIAKLALTPGFYRLAGGFRAADDVDTHGWSHELAILHIVGDEPSGGIASLKATIGVTKISE
jgi:ABC-type polysaccharide/polyol phosphate transport system ATPase subunit